MIIPQLTKMLGGPKIYVKRDDLTAIAFGGNKTRKLEFLMADAVKQNADYRIRHRNAPPNDAF